MRNPSIRPHRGTGQARIIRRVVRYHKVTKQPKVARDYNSRIDAHRIHAAATHHCTYPGCVDKRIERGTDYVEVFWPDQGKRVGHRIFPEGKKFHVACVPPTARPLVRLLFPGTRVAAP